MIRDRPSTFFDMFGSERILVLDADTIKRFTKATGDTNDLHNVAIMAEKGRHAYSPGMLTLAHALAETAPLFFRGANTANIVFSPMFDGDWARIGVRRAPFSRNGKIYAIKPAAGNEDVETASGTISHVEPASLFTARAGAHHEIGLEGLDVLCQELDVGTQWGHLLHAVACTSQAGWLHSQQDAYGGAQARELIESGKVPAYHTISVGLHRDPRLLGPTSTVKYVTNVEFSQDTSGSKPRDVAELTAYCYDDNGPICTVASTALVVPLKSLVRTAKRKK